VELEALRRRLAGTRWLHAHEEDHGAVRVYRPAHAPLPPARGREGFELREDGSCSAREVGPGDRPVETPGSWTLRAEQGPLLVLDPGSDHEQRFRVLAVERDRLDLERVGRD
jgi:hypothetical protein